MPAGENDLIWGFLKARWAPNDRIMNIPPHSRPTSIGEHDAADVSPRSVPPHSLTSIGKHDAADASPRSVSEGYALSWLRNARNERNADAESARERGLPSGPWP